MAQEFSGKFTFATPQGLMFTVGTDAAAVVTLEAEVKDDPLQRFNTYGSVDADIWMQGSNGFYLVYDTNLLTYTSTLPRDGAVSVFRIEDAQPNIRILEVTPDAKEFYISANGAVLERIPKDANPPNTTLFLLKQITVGVSGIKPGSISPDLDLSYAFLAGADFTGVRFYSANFSFANIESAKIKGAIFSGATCTGMIARNCVFDSVTFSAVQANKADLKSAIFEASSTFSGAVFDEAILTNLVCNGRVSLNGISGIGANFDGAKMQSIAMNNAKLDKASFVGVDFRYAQVASTHFEEAVLNRCQFSNARVQSSSFNSAVLVGIDFTGSEMNESTFIDANLTNAILQAATSLWQVDFSGAQLIGAQLAEVDFVAEEIKFNKDTNFTQAMMDGVNLTEYKLDKCIFLYASLKGATLDKVSCIETTFTQANLSYCSITGNVQFYGANLSNTKLEGAHLNGGQFGPLKGLGTIKVKNTTALQADPLPFAKALKLDAEILHVEARSGHQSWSIKAGGRHFLAYSKKEEVELYEVSETLQGAVLSNAYMPNAILKEANLYAVDMTGAQWYGGSADASGANMELVNLTNSNVATMDFTQAKLYGANFSFANMVQTNFYKAELTATAGQKPVSMAFASMQGTNFEEASIYDANLTNAAISLLIEKSSADLTGDPLFEMDQSFGQYLDAGFLTQDLVDLFATNNITVTQEDTLVVLSLGSIWMLAPSASNNNSQYILVYPEGEQNITVLGQLGQGSKTTIAPDIIAVPLANMSSGLIEELNKGTMTPDIKKAFVDVGYPLIDTAGFVVVKTDERWAFRNMHLDKTVVQQGYGQFELRKETADQGDQLKLYGAAPLVVMRTSAGNTIERVSVQFGETQLTPVNMNKTTTTPSGLKFGLLSSQLSYEYLMSPGLPPSPPSCIPSPTSWCP